MFWRMCWNLLKPAETCWSRIWWIQDGSSTVQVKSTDLSVSQCAMCATEACFGSFDCPGLCQIMAFTWFLCGSSWPAAIDAGRAAPGFTSLNYVKIFRLTLDKYIPSVPENPGVCCFQAQFCFFQTWRFSWFQLIQLSLSGHWLEEYSQSTQRCSVCCIPHSASTLRERWKVGWWFVWWPVEAD